MFPWSHRPMLVRSTFQKISQSRSTGKFELKRREIQLLIIKLWIRYILDAGSQFVVIFKIIISIIVVPNVLLNLYIMAFGFGEDKNYDLWQILNYSEAMFFLEILQNFFTSFSDPEHYDVVTSLKEIA